MKKWILSSLLLSISTVLHADVFPLKGTWQSDCVQHQKLVKLGIGSMKLSVDFMSDGSGSRIAYFYKDIDCRVPTDDHPVAIHGEYKAVEKMPYRYDVKIRTTNIEDISVGAISEIHLDIEQFAQGLAKIRQTRVKFKSTFGETSIPKVILKILGKPHTYKKISD